MAKFTKSQAAAARSLAIAYDAFNEVVSAPRSPERDNGVRVWGPLLLRAQEETGVELKTPAVILRSIEIASAKDAA